jgi:hypothetical protein
MNAYLLWMERFRLSPERVGFGLDTSRTGPSQSRRLIRSSDSAGVGTTTKDL